MAQAHYYSFEQLDSLQQREPRPVAVFIYTDWCRFCAMMENTTLQDERVIAQLNEAFYFVALDAEEERDIVVGGRVFGYQPSGNHTGEHELAEQLGTIEGTLSYPTLCFLNPAYEITFQYNQFISADDLSRVLKKLTLTTNKSRDATLVGS